MMNATSTPSAKIHRTRPTTDATFLSVVVVELLKNHRKTTSDTTAKTAAIVRFSQ